MPTHDTYAEPYYKILVPLPRTGSHMMICTLQEFDEFDYEKDEWLSDDNGVVSFNTKEAAQQYLADNVDTKWIHPDDRIAKSHVNNYRIHSED